MKQARPMMVCAAIVSVIVCGWTFRAGAESGAQEIDRAKVCMLEDTVQAKPGVEHRYNGKTYYICCEGCAGKFDANGEEHATAKDPVTGQMVDKATAPVMAYGDRAYFFASDDSRGQFAKEPARYATKAAKPKDAM